MKNHFKVRKESNLAEQAKSQMVPIVGIVDRTTQPKLSDFQSGPVEISHDRTTDSRKDSRFSFEEPKAKFRSDLSSEDAFICTGIDECSSSQECPTGSQGDWNDRTVNSCLTLGKRIKDRKSNVRELE